MPFARHKDFYKDPRSGEIYQYIADGCLINPRQVICWCVQMSSGEMAAVAVATFQTIFVKASEAEVNRAIVKNRQTREATMQQMQRTRIA